MNMLNKYPDKVKSNKRRLIININKSNLSDDNYNHFLNGEDLELPTFKKNNYQNQFINRKLFLSNSKKKKNKYILNFEHYNKEENRMKNNNNNYYSNSSKIPKNIENDFINDSLTDNYDHLKNNNNNNIKDILLKTKKEIQSSYKKREEIQKIEKENKNNYKFYKINKSNNELNLNKNEINELNNYNYNNGIFNEILINDIDRNKINNIQKKDFIIDKNEGNEINIKGNIVKKDLSNLKIDEFSKEYQNKLNKIKENNKNKSINVEQLINELYEYKVKYEKFKLMLNSKSSKKEKQEINDNLSKIKEENSKLNLQKKFLINELTKSVYNIEILRHKYKNELDRFSSYLNKIKYDLKEKSIESNI